MDLEKNPWLFEGHGDPQFDCYRAMRKASKGRWGEHVPKTNLIWIRYLAHKLVTDKATQLDDRPDVRDAIRAFMKRVLRYKSVRTLLKDPFFCLVE